jgi:predicted nucleic acid-binding protein
LETVVLDANFGIALVWPTCYSTACYQHLQDWVERGVAIFVPGLWEYEVCSALRKLWVQNLLTRDRALQGIASLYKLPFQRVLPDAALSQQAILWAERVGQRVAYDAPYLALAEKMGAVFWTADRKLFERCQKIGVEFASLLN